MAFPTPAQGKPDGSGQVRNPAYFTFDGDRYGINVSPYRYGWDPAGAGTYSDNALGQAVGMKFYGDTATDVDAADAGATIMTLGEAVSNGICAKVKITYQIPLPPGSPANSKPRRQQAIVYVPMDKVEEAVKNFGGKEYYDNLKIVRVQVA